jgi:NAD(P)-dependent dehydrogenase (short-subunit alcohol dehydrogenase family)
MALALAEHGMSLCLSGRDAGRLEEGKAVIAARGARAMVHQSDLSSDAGIRSLAARVGAEFGRLDVLVHAAGDIRLGDVEAAQWDDLDRQYRVNLRAPFLLTKALLPLLKSSGGQVVFINSSAGLAAGADNALYAATKHALRALAGSIRDHLNRFGVRVLSVFPGRTATPMQEAVHRFEGRSYDAAALLQPEDVAEVIVRSLALPRTAEVTEIMIRSMKKLPAAH